MPDIILTHSLSAAGTIRRLFRKRKSAPQTRVIASYDDYSHGPLPTSARSDDFLLTRQAFWASLDLYDVDVPREFDLPEEYNALVQKITSEIQVEIWIAETVQDLFFAVVILHLLSLDRVDTSGISIRHFDGSEMKWGLGVLRVEELENLYKSNHSIAVDTNLYDQLWEALSQGSGNAIDSLLKKQDLSASIAKTLSTYLLRFPDFNGGLGSIERSLLGSCTTKMKKSAHTIANAMAWGEPENDCIGDLLLFRKLVEMSEVVPDPWFKFEGNTRYMRSCWVQLTESGRDARLSFSVG